MKVDQFTHMFLNDVTGNEDKNKEIANAEERIRYSEIVAALCAGGAVLCSLVGGLAWLGAGALCLVAVIKMRIVANKRGWL